MFWFVGLLWVRKKVLSVSALGSRDQHSSFNSSSVSLAPRTYSSKHILKYEFSLSDRVRTDLCTGSGPYSIYCRLNWCQFIFLHWHQSNRIGSMSPLMAHLKGGTCTPAQHLCLSLQCNPGQSDVCCEWGVWGRPAVTWMMLCCRPRHRSRCRLGFGLTQVGPNNHMLDWVQTSHGKGQLGFFLAQWKSVAICVVHSSVPVSQYWNVDTALPSGGEMSFA